MESLNSLPNGAFHGPDCAVDGKRDRSRAHAERHQAIDDLDAAILKLSSKINAATYELLVLIREFNERAGFLKWGFDNCTAWLHWRCDLSPSAAREKIRVAQALKELPTVSSHFRKGRLSYSKVRAITRVASRKNEHELVRFALNHTAGRVEEYCRQLRYTQPEEASLAQRILKRRHVSFFRDDRRGVVRMTVELPLEEGELVHEALGHIVERLPNGPEFEESSVSQQHAEALVQMAKQSLSASNDSKVDRSNSRQPNQVADHYQVMIHVDASALERGEGRSDLPLTSLKRMTCDGGIRTLIHDSRGEPLSVGRKTRTVPVALKKALWARDKGCVFPGCGRRRFVDAHHIRHWSDGGETSLGNLMLLCSSHHRLVHEGGFVLRQDHHGRWYFKRPDGRAVPVSGYQPADFIDDDLGLNERANNLRNTSIPEQANSRCGASENDHEQALLRNLTFAASAEALDE